MNASIKTSRLLLKVALLALLACVLLVVVGCGGTKATPSTARTATRVEARLPRRPQPAGDVFTPKNDEVSRQNQMACEAAVRSAPSLTAAAEHEIAALCYRMNYVREDNEKTVRSVCQEVANASSLTSDAARKRTISACYEAGMG
ncbi:MAG TPA: hypothetical protein VGF47_05025 [Solirubrobacteraceae bacterium]|jgi:hypothetical protein